MRISCTFLLYWFLLKAAEAIARSADWAADRAADGVHGQDATRNGGGTV